MRGRNGSSVFNFAHSQDYYLRARTLERQKSAPSIYFLYTKSRAALGKNFSRVRETRRGLLVLRESCKKSIIHREKKDSTSNSTLFHSQCEKGGGETINIAGVLGLSPLRLNGGSLLHEFPRVFFKTSADFS